MLERGGKAPHAGDELARAPSLRRAVERADELLDGGELLRVRAQRFRTVIHLGEGRSCRESAPEPSHELTLRLDREMQEIVQEQALRFALHTLDEPVRALDFESVPLVREFHETDAHRGSNCNRPRRPGIPARMLLYDELVPWYRLIDPLKDHLDEATAYREALVRALGPGSATLLELGAGAGNNAFYLKEHFRCTLTDLSEGMQRLSRETNIDCEHVLGDMRSLRIGRTFDAVFVHDAVMYITSPRDLEAVVRTAFEHTRPGGVALFAPDFVRESFRERADFHKNDDGDRMLCALEWSWDPDPADDTFATEFSFLLRDGTTMRSVHDHHVEGLFARATWLGLFEKAGYRVESLARPFDDDVTDEMFLCRRP